MHGYGYGYGWMPWGYGMGLLMLLFWIVAVIVIAALVAWLVRGIGGRALAPPAVRTAVQILEERYARGEIGREEFMQKKKDLES